MKYIGLFPLIALVLIAYNVVAFGAGVHGGADATDPVRTFMTGTVFSIPTASHEALILTVGDLFVIFGLITLVQEILRATHIDTIELVNHGISLMIFIVALVEFLLIRGFATATFFILMLMTLVDVLAGFVISLAASRRQVEVTRE
jgi:hypothetical protein